VKVMLSSTRAIANFSVSAIPVSVESSSLKVRPSS